MLSRKEQKFIKSLKVKKYRTREKSFLVEGAKNVLELLGSDFEVQMVIGTHHFFLRNECKGNHRNEEVGKDVLSQLGTFKTNEDVIAIAKMKEWDPTDIHLDDFVFVLDGVGDPGNMGTIIRTLDWFGFDQLVCSMDCAEFYHPKVINSTMGSFTRIKCFSQDLSEFFSKSKLPVFAADMEGQPLDKFTFPKPSIIVMGSESHGLGERSLAYSDQRVTIPQFGDAESLNVAIATGIFAAHLRMFK